MDGFFSRKETESKSRPDGKFYSCATCGLYKKASTPKMKPWGDYKKSIMIINDTPSEADDDIGKPWQGPSGMFFKKVLKEHKINVQKDCITIQAVRCTPYNKDNEHIGCSSRDITFCRRFALNYIKEYQPKIIILCGINAINSIIGHRWKKDLGTINKWRGWVIPDQDFKSWLAPITHPKDIVGQKDDIHRVLFHQDISRIADHVEKPWPRLKKYDIKYIKDLSILNTINTGQVAIDYETTGIKPHANGHRIICAAVADSPDHAYTFLIPTKKKERQPLIDLLARHTVGKMAHNMKYEENWSVNRLKQSVVSWEWDSMVAAHILDNRSGITGLKFQTYVHFGVVDYASEINTYLSSNSKDGNSLNRIKEILLDERKIKELLKYCALDVIFERRLAEKQMELMNWNHLPF